MFANFRNITLFFLFAAILISGGRAFAQRVGGEFAPGLRRIQDLPQGRFRAQLEGLPAPARERALGWLGSLHFTARDVDHLHLDRDGGVFYVDEFPLPAGVRAATEVPTTTEVAVPISPFPAALKFHSRPGAPNVLYINFCGENVTGTAWNSSEGKTNFAAMSFSMDSDHATFNDAEQAAIKRIWQRIAEDYAPFNIDVTTERPGTFNSRTAHLLVTRNTDANGVANPASTAGGVAYVNVFGATSFGSYRPAWVYYNNLGSDESYIAEAGSHEVGHNLGLSHDGKTDGSDYYGGHGSGDTSWAPIMGVGYNRNVSQWSKGEYYLANNTQDDLATIAAKINYRSDDHGNSASAATALIISGGTNIFSTTPQNDPTNTNTLNKGVIEQNNDVDVFSFVTGNGLVTLTANPWINSSGTYGGNVDLVLELYNSAGQLLVTNNLGERTFSRIETTLSDGVYYLHVKSAGTGNPSSSTPVGYTQYGSIGQYFISGTVTPSGAIIPPGAELAVTDVTQTGAGVKQFTVTYSDNAAINVSTIDSSDILVTGPNGYLQSARLVSVSSTMNGTPRTATYAIDPPNSNAWLVQDNGTYLVSMVANQVADTEGAFVAGQELGVFSVALPQSIYYQPMDSNPGWTLESQWQYGRPSYPSGGPGAGYTGTNIIGFNLSGNYPNNLPLSYAISPVINCSGASSLTLKFRRWLRLRNGDTALIQVSTNGATWSSIWLTSRAVSDSSWQEVQYSLPSWTTGATGLRVRWGISSGASQNDIGWNIDDVEILGDGLLDVIPPTAVLSVANLAGAGAVSHPLTVAYTDNIAVAVSTLGGSNLMITGPNGFSRLADFTGVDNLPDGSPRTAAYSVPAPGALWDAQDNGTYVVTLQDNQVSDTSGNDMPAAVLGSFTVAIPASSQSIVVSTASLSITEGSNATFTVRLAEPPAAPVLVNISQVNGDSNLVVQSGALLTFNSLNWSNPAPVIIAALPDADQENGAATFECRADGIPSATIVATEIDSTPNNILTVLVNNALWGRVEPAGNSYPVGTVIDVTAIPQPLYKFTRWTGDYNTSANPLSVRMNGNVSIEAVFEKIDTEAPTAALLHETIQASDFTNYLFSVRYEDNNGVQLSSITSSNLIVTGPGGFSNSVSLVGILQTADGTPIEAAYMVSVPVVAGQYSIYLSPEQIFDLSENFAISGSLGTFLVHFPQQSFIVEPAQLSVTEGQSNSFRVTLAYRPASNIIATVSHAGGDEDLMVAGSSNLQFNSSNWTNIVVISAHPDVDQVNGTAEFQISAAGLPVLNVSVAEVDTTPDVLLTATVNNSAWGSVQPTGVFYPVGTSVQVSAAPASSFYRFAQWAGDVTSSENPITVQMDSNVVLQAIFEKIDSTAPVASLLVETNTSTDFTLIVTYTDNQAVKTSSINSSNIAIVGPGTDLVELVSVSQLEDGSPLVATYKATLLAKGEYQVVLRGNQVSDTFDNFAEEMILGKLYVVLPESVVLTVTPGEKPWGVVSVTNQAYIVNDLATVTAIPHPYFRFIGWSGDIHSTNNPLSFVITSNTSVQAVFAEEITPVYSVPFTWLASNGYTNELAASETFVGANGMQLWQSYIAGLDPNEPTSKLEINIQRAGTETVVSWQPVEGRTYTLLSAANPAGPYLQLLRMPATISSLTNAVEGMLFYKLEVSLDNGE